MVSTFLGDFLQPSLVNLCAKFSVNNPKSNPSRNIYITKGTWDKRYIYFLVISFPLNVENVFSSSDNKLMYLCSYCLSTRNTFWISKMVWLLHLVRKNIARNKYGKFRFIKYFRHYNCSNLLQRHAFVYIKSWYVIIKITH